MDTKGSLNDKKHEVPKQINGRLPSGLCPSPAWCKRHHLHQSAAGLEDSSQEFAALYTSQIRTSLNEFIKEYEVWLNGEQAGVRICPPYRVEIDGLIKKGKNKLVIEVTNTLVKDQRDFLSSFVQQEPSGLIGPIQVKSIMMSES